MALPGFAVGDVVHLTSGGPAMTVIRVVDADYVFCAWFSVGDVYGEAEFIVSVLVAGAPPLVGMRL